jgi:23S rRNA pseudouridine1911/1915/1917 synthase
MRLDKFLATKYASEYSREELKTYIQQGFVFVSQKPVIKPSFEIDDYNKDEVIIDQKKITEMHFMASNVQIPEKILAKIKIIAKQKDFLVIDKPAGLLVHKTNNPHSYSLVEWLLEHYPEVNQVGEPLEDRDDGNHQRRDGIVHRIDKDTSGLLLIARNNEGYTELKKLFFEHKIQKTYLCLVYGKLKQNEGTIMYPISRSKLNHAKRVPVLDDKNIQFYDKKREAITHYKVLNVYKVKDQYFSFCEVQIQTGRTHQIRVHMKAIGHPVYGDKLYGGKTEQKNTLLNRQFLHAHKLEFEYNNQNFVFQSDLPEDLQNIIENLHT